tara:strand:- start:144 stop:590 length:447 start_codon:yes stop_codon:yes gene_type:complete
MTRFLVMTFGAIVLFVSPICHADDSVGDLNEEPIPAIDAKDNLGQYRIVCGKVKKVNLKKYGAFINMGDFTTLPNGMVVLSPSFTAIMWETDRVKLEVNPREEFLGNNVCFSGVISSSPINRYTHRQIPQITIKDLRQIRIPEQKINN